MLALEGLTQVNADGRVVPRIAERWQWEHGGLVLRVFVRPRVKFHNGTPLTAAVAAEVLERVISRPSNRALYPSVSDITEVHAEGELQLVIRLSQPSTFLLEDLSVPLQLGDSVGTGPYRVTKRQGSEITLERFNEYYLGKPSIDRVVLRPFDALRTTWSSLLRGEVDSVTDIPPESVEFIRNEEIQTISFPRWYQFVLAFNFDNLSLSPRVRRALNLAVDRQALTKSALKGYGTPSTGPLWPRHWAYDNTVQPFSFDPAAAVALFDAAGLSKGSAKSVAGGLPGARLRFTCLVPSTFSVLERLGLELQRQLYEVGIDMQFEAVSLDEYLARLSAGKFEAVLVDMISGPSLVRPYIFWRSKKAYKGLNVFGYENAEAERQFQTVRTATSEAAIRSATSRLERLFLDDPPAVFLAWSERARVVRREFRVVQEPGRDPISTLWRWTPSSTPVQTASLR